MPDVHPLPLRRKAGDPSLPIRRLDAFIAAAEGLLDAWDPVLEGGGYPRNLHSFDELIADLRDWRYAAAELATIRASDVRPVDFSDPQEVRDWLRQLSCDIEDALAAGDDATRPLRRRMLGPALARTHLLDARRSLRQLLEAAERGAPPLEPEPH